MFVCPSIKKLESYFWHKSIKCTILTHNYSDTAACPHHDEDEAQLIRAVICPFMRRCCKAQLANKYKNEYLWHRSG